MKVKQYRKITRKTRVSLQSNKEMQQCMFYILTLLAYDCGPWIIGFFLKVQKIGRRLFKSSVQTRFTRLIVLMFATHSLLLIEFKFNNKNSALIWWQLLTLTLDPALKTIRTWWTSGSGILNCAVCFYSNQRFKVNKPAFFFLIKFFSLFFNSHSTFHFSTMDSAQSFHSDLS